MSVRCPGCMRLKENSPICEHCGYDERSQNNTHQLPVGTVLGGHFTLGRVLGQGGFGITYLGWDGVLQCAVAVKEFFPTGYATRDVRSSTVVTSYDSADIHTFEENKLRFLREAESLAKLWGIPQIVKVFRYFEENGTAYIALEYIEGENLLEYMKRLNRPLTVEELFDLLGPVMQALVHVHRADLVHRDISPDNIMVMPDGSTRLLDFGAARYVENADAARERNTSTQAILKHGFAPPEQYSSHGALGPWSDVYALCATVYFCLTGQKPIEAMNRIIDDQQLGWEKIPGLTRRQISVLNQGMELKPQNRVQSVQQLYDELFGEILEAREKAKQEAEAEAKHRERQRRKEQERLRQEAEAEAKRQEELRRQEEKRQQQEARRKEAQRLKEARTEARKEKKKQDEPGSGKKWLPLASAAAAVVIAVGLFFAKSPEKTEEPEIRLSQTESTVGATIPTTETIVETTAETQPEEPWRKNVLIKSFAYTPEEATSWYEQNRHKVKYGTISLSTNKGIEHISEKTYQNFLSSRKIYGSEIPRGQIVEAIFLDTLQDAPEHAWDVSLSQDRSVLAWTESLGREQYKLFLAGEGGINGAVGCERLFEGYTGLRSIQFNGAFHTEGVSSMYSMFYKCVSLNDLDVSFFDTASVRDMDYMFSDCSSLTTLDVSAWNTSKVTSMTWLFDRCSNLTTLDVSNWDTSNVTYMYSMFNDCSGLVELDVSGWDTSNVRNMFNLFGGCSSLTRLEVSAWDTSNVTSMSFLFYGCSSLAELDTSSWDVSNVSYMNDVFYGCWKLPAEFKKWAADNSPGRRGDMDDDLHS